MTETKSDETLKKQLGSSDCHGIGCRCSAGIKYVCLFVSNNSVKATTSGISAQSNAAFMVIKYNEKTDANSETTDKSTTTGPTTLYPAQVVANGVWQSAFAKESGKADENTSTRFTIKSEGKADGSAAAAVAANYAMKETFYIGSKAGAFENLKVTGIEATNNNSKLDTAIRVMVVCGQNWVVYDGTGKKVTITGEKADEILADKIEHVSDTDNGDKQVDVYVYYDGADSKVFTDQEGMFTGDIKLTVTFGATNKDLGGSSQVTQDQNAAPQQ